MLPIIRLVAEAGDSVLASLFMVGHLDQAPVIDLAARPQPGKWQVTIKSQNRTIQIVREGETLTAQESGHL